MTDTPLPDLIGWGEVTFNEVKVGDRLQVDDNFSCVAANSVVEVKSDENGLYFDCSAGIDAKARHYLAAQIFTNDDGQVALAGMRRPRS